MAEDFEQPEQTARTKRMNELEHQAHRRSIATWIGGIITVAFSLIGAGWTAKTYMGHVATASEVEKLKASAAIDRERMAAIEQAHNDDRDWRNRIEQKVDKLIDWALGRTRRSDGR